MNTIETYRFLLRNFTRNDATGLFAYLHQPVASCFLTLEDISAAEAEAETRSRSDENIAVCLKDTEQLIGDFFAVPDEDTWSIGWSFRNPGRKRRAKDRRRVAGYRRQVRYRTRQNA